MTRKIREYLNYFLPREIIGPVFVVFSLEHVIEILFAAQLTQGTELYGWTALFILSLVVIGYWGLKDDDYDELVEK